MKEFYTPNFYIHVLLLALLLHDANANHKSVLKPFCYNNRFLRCLAAPFILHKKNPLTTIFFFTNAQIQAKRQYVFFKMVVIFITHVRWILMKWILAYMYICVDRIFYLLLFKMDQFYRNVSFKFNNTL